MNLMGLRLDPLSEAETVTTALAASERGEGGWICPANLDVLRQYVRSAEVRDLVDEADVVVADGMPLIWASRLAGRALPERVAGSSLIWTLPEQAARRGASVFLLGGSPGAAEGAAEQLERRGARIAGTLCPPLGFERDRARLAEISRALREAAPDIVFVGLGFPKQEQLIRRLRRELPHAWFVSCGASMSFASGELKRAPRWQQRLGLEWLYRLAQEPRRLFRRYVVDGIPFAGRMLASALATRMRSA
jgi:N-acetylglucosaminyldiphosphoundecaprenol N-acetyl-beta-D-mannosaminyltransferase